MAVRNPSRLAADRNSTRVITTDLAAPDYGALESAVAGADAVLSGVGPRPMAKAGVAEHGTRAIVAAMQAIGVRRVIVVSAAPMTMPSPGRPHPPRHDPGEGFLMKYLGTPVFKAVLRERYTDLALMEDLLRASGLDWTIFRPPRLTNGRLAGRYRTALGRNLKRASVSRRRRARDAGGHREAGDDPAGDRYRRLTAKEPSLILPGSLPTKCCRPGL